MKLGETEITNHKISTKAVKSNEIQAVNERRCGEIVSGCTSQQGWQDGQNAERGEACWVAWPKSLIWKNKKRTSGFQSNHTCTNSVI